MPRKVATGHEARSLAQGIGRPEAMYQFSRSMYRELAEDVTPGRNGDVCHERQRFLRACETSMERLALDRHYFAKPVKTLFRDVRSFFPITHQMRVYRVVERHVELAREYVDEQ